MDDRFAEALTRGAERLSAWADVLDGINVFPVADGDTGRNLAASLVPLRQTNGDHRRLIRNILMAARGNSGNISARFFSGFLQSTNGSSLQTRARLGRDLAWKSVPEPRHGTILSFFDDLVDTLGETATNGEEPAIAEIVERLEESVRSTTDRLPELKAAGVVDAGALGMFVFFDAFFHVLGNRDGSFVPIGERFGDLLHIDPLWNGGGEDGFCIDAVFQAGADTGRVVAELTDSVESVVAIEDGDVFKLHFHTRDARQARERLSRLGGLLRVHSDDLGAQTRGFAPVAKTRSIHVMTDAAGSVTRADARAAGMTLLDSYVTVGAESFRETHVDPEQLYAAMRDGVPVSTSQASDFERGENYRRVLDLHDRVLYLCVGSAYTGNFAAARAWKQENDPKDRLTVVDTGYASGRLGLAAVAAAEFAHTTDNAAVAIDRAKAILAGCEEILFLDRLEYLAKGGRMSKSGAFFGDALGVKPIVAPTPRGAEKVGVVRRHDRQVAFAIEYASARVAVDAPSLFLLQYSDNIERIESQIRPAIERAFPAATVRVRPLSLTTGVHTGPGTWAMAFLSVPSD